VAKLICAGSCGAIHGAKTANTIKHATKTQPIAANGLRLARRGSEIAVVAIAEIAEASLANQGSLAGISMSHLKSPGTLLFETRMQVFTALNPGHSDNSINHKPLPLCTITTLLGH
jgi:hypothetical protein